MNHYLHLFYDQYFHILSKYGLWIICLAPSTPYTQVKSNSTTILKGQLAKVILGRGLKCLDICSLFEVFADYIGEMPHNAALPLGLHSAKVPA